MNLEKIIAVRPAKTVYRDGDRVIKLFNQDFSKADVLNEALNQARVEETGLRIPRLLEVTKEGGRWAIVMEHVPGKTLETLMREEPGEAGRYLERFVEIQMEIHGKRAPLLNSLAGKMRRKLAASPLDAVTRYELRARLDAMERHETVCHGDFNPSNVIVTGDGEAYVIDWAHATRGDAAADAARTYLLFQLTGDAAAADAYLDLFCARSGVERRRAQRWMPIVAASQMVKGREPEKEFLRRWTSVVEYQ